MTPQEVESILGPPHKILTANSQGLTEEQEDMKPGPNQPDLVVYWYRGQKTDDGTEEWFLAVGFEESRGTQWIVDRTYPTKNHTFYDVVRRILKATGIR
jgi:hypothetical protein